MHSYYGGLILDSGLGAVLHVGVLVSICHLHLWLSWLTQYVETTAGRALGMLETDLRGNKSETCFCGCDVIVPSSLYVAEKCFGCSLGCYKMQMNLP